MARGRGPVNPLHLGFCPLAALGPLRGQKPGTPGYDPPATPSRHRAMKRQHLYRRRTRNREIAWFPCRDPKPGQRLTVTKYNGFDRVTEDIWYHSDDWTPVDLDVPRP